MDNKKATLELGTQPVGKLLMQYALPAIVAMVASSLYNMVDSIFIGQGVGPMAISGLALSAQLSVWVHPPSCRSGSDRKTTTRPRRS